MNDQGPRRLPRPFTVPDDHALSAMIDLLEEARLQELLAVHREERVDAVADDAHDLTLTPARVTHEIALLERTENRALHALDLERAPTAAGVAAPHRFLEERLAHLRIAAAARAELRGHRLG